jgi:hypothetical protein
MPALILATMQQLKRLCYAVLNPIQTPSQPNVSLLIGNYTLIGGAHPRSLSVVPFKFYDGGSTFVLGTPLPKGMSALHNLCFVHPMNTESVPFGIGTPVTIGLRVEAVIKFRNEGVGGGFSELRQHKRIFPEKERICSLYIACQAQRALDRSCR